MKIILNACLWLIAIYVLFIICVYLFQDKIIFQPKQLKDNYSFQFDSPFEELWLDAADGVKINALFFPSEEKRGAILYLHGNRDNLQRWAAYHKDFTPRGYDFLAIDYRGYGKSAGHPEEQGLYRDAKAGYEWLLQHYAPAQIILYGRSLGTAPASYLAKEIEAKTLVLETPYNTIKGALVHSIPFVWFPFAFKSIFSNENHLDQVEEPVYILHGTKDGVVPYSSAILLKPHLKQGDQFITIEGGGHKNLNSFPEYYQYLDQILSHE